MGAAGSRRGLLALVAVVLAIGFAWWIAGEDAPTLSIEHEPDRAAAASARPASAVVLDGVARAVERERAAVATRDHAAEPSADATELGSLEVAVVERESGAPIAGARVWMLPVPWQPEWTARDAQRSIGAPRDRLITDRDGLARFEVPAGTRWHVLALADALSDHEPRSPVEPLASGERRTLRLEVATRSDRRLHGRVLAADDDRPIAGASIAIGGSADSLRAECDRGPWTTDGDGRFDLVACAWTQPMITVRAEGFGAVIASVTASHETPDAALTIRLTRSATLIARVCDPSGAPQPSIEVRATVAGEQLLQREGPITLGRPRDASWTATTDGDGRALLADVASGVEIALSLLRRGEPAGWERDPVRLAPGERREVALVVGVGATVRGVLVDQHSRAIGGATLWLVRATPDQQALLRDHLTPWRAVETDSNGRFEIERVPPGEWRLGPAPTRDASDPVDPTALAPFGELLSIAVDRSELELDLRAWRGLYVRGWVVDANGASVAGSQVHANGREVELWCDARSDAAGRFAIGPLPDLELDVMAAGVVGASHSETAIARPGGDELELRLRRAAGMTVEFRDRATLHAAPVQLVVRYAESPTPETLVIAFAEGGRYVLGVLRPGRYVLIATSTAGLLGWRVADVGEVDATVAVDLHPAARLRLKHQGDSPIVARIAVGDVELDRRALEPGSDDTVAVPAGEIVVSVDGGETRTLVLAPGDERALDL